MRSTFNNINIRNMIFMVWTQTKENNITIQDITHLWYCSFVLMTFPFPLWNSSFQIQDGLKKEITKSKKKILKSFNYSERTSNLKALRENCQNPESFLVRIFLHLDRIQGNMKKNKTKKNRKKFVLGHFLRSEWFWTEKQYSPEISQKQMQIEITTINTFLKKLKTQFAMWILHLKNNTAKKNEPSPVFLATFFMKLLWV